MDIRLAAVLFTVMLLAGCTANPQDLAQPPGTGGTGGIGSTGAGGGTTGGGTSSQGNGSGSGTPGVGLFTMEEVAKHNSKYDCWMVIDGMVLDITSYVSHPGGNTYVPFCGTGATAAFNDKGGIGSNHSSRAFEMLRYYMIGEIGKPMPGPQAGPGVDGGGIAPPPNDTGNADGGAANPPTNASTAPAGGTSTNQTAPSLMLTLGEVAKHNSANDCWMVINGKVLNLTVFSSHPGGSTYVPFCGTEATAAFDNKGGRGNSHSGSAVADLSIYTIGLLGEPQNRSIDAGNVSISGRWDDDDEWDDDD
jgi:cytochrome b involved in lipid metabolism